MGKGIQVRNGQMMFWRLGDLKFDKQSRWDRAPESRGMWAFPWPYFEMFFAYHKFTDALPKRLQLNEQGFPIKPEWYGMETDEQVWIPCEWSARGGYYVNKMVPLDPQNLPDDLWVTVPVENGDSYVEYNEKYGTLPEFYTERDRWIKDVGPKVVKLRKFMVEGSLYTHFNPYTGEVDELDVWHKVDVTTYAELVRKNRGDRVWYRNTESGEFSSGGSYTKDHFEVFLTRDSVKILGGK